MMCIVCALCVLLAVYLKMIRLPVQTNSFQKFIPDVLSVCVLLFQLESLAFLLIALITFML